jgi:hypothetical protein
MYIDFLKRISTDRITFLSDVSRQINVDKTNFPNYFFSDSIEIKQIEHFLNNLKFDSLYTVNLMISLEGKREDPYIVLSKTILLSKYSNAITINDYILSRYEIAQNQFYFDLDSYYIIFKYKKVYLDM